MKSPPPLGATGDSQFSLVAAAMIAVAIAIRTMVAARAVVSPIATSTVVVAVVVIGAGGRTEGQRAEDGENGQLAGFESRHLKSPNTPVSGSVMHAG